MTHYYKAPDGSLIEAASTLTKGKSDFTLTRSSVESGEASTRRTLRKLPVTAADGLPRGLHGASGTPDSRECGCGCNGSFLISKYNPQQKYIAGHRFRAYEAHACPSCGSVHRMKVKA